MRISILSRVAAAVHRLTDTGLLPMYDVQNGLAVAAPSVLRAFVADEICEVLDACARTRTERSERRRHHCATLPRPEV